MSSRGAGWDFRPVRDLSLRAGLGYVVSRIFDQPARALDIELSAGWLF